MHDFMSLYNICIATLMVVWTAMAPVQATTNRLTIHMSGFKNDKGMAMVAVHNTPKTFLKKTAPFRSARVAITQLKSVAEFDDIPPGKYVVAVFHDENDNQDLDGNLMRIPTEHYGFSNNAWRKFGPAKYKDAEFELADTPMMMDITLRTAFEKN